MFYEYLVTYSPDDGGYYAEIWANATGVTVHETKVVPCRQLARQNALDWIMTHDGKVLI